MAFWVPKKKTTTLKPGPGGQCGPEAVGDQADYPDRRCALLAVYLGIKNPTGLGVRPYHFVGFGDTGKSFRV